MVPRPACSVAVPVVLAPSVSVQNLQILTLPGSVHAHERAQPTVMPDSALLDDPDVRGGEGASAAMSGLNGSVRA